MLLRNRMVRHWCSLALVAFTSCEVTAQSPSIERPKTVYNAQYDDDSGRGYYASDSWVGNEIRLAAGPRMLVGIEFGYAIGMQASGTVDVAARLYANDGPDGSPLSLLWDSGLYSDQAIQGKRFVNFQVPTVDVPEVLTVMTRVFNTHIPLPPTPYPPGDASVMASELKPTAGEVLQTWVHRENGDTPSWGRFEPNYPLSIRIVAIPEPGTMNLLLLAWATIIGFRCRQVSRKPQPALNVRGETQVVW